MRNEDEDLVEDDGVGLVVNPAEEVTAAQATEAVACTEPIDWTYPEGSKRNGLAIRRKRQRVFLAAFKKCGVITAALKAAAINNNTERAWRIGVRADPWYIQQFQDAYEEYADSIRQVVHTRAVDGMEMPIVGKKQVEVAPGVYAPEDTIIGFKTVYDSNMLIFLAKKVDPSFRDSFIPKEAPEKVQETISPLTRISIQLDVMGQRQTIAVTTGKPDALPEGEIIDVPAESTATDD